MPDTVVREGKQERRDHILPLAPFKRFFDATGVNRVQGGAIYSLREIMEAQARILANKAYYLCIHAGRVSVRSVDVKFAHGFSKLDDFVVTDSWDQARMGEIIGLLEKGVPQRFKDTIVSQKDRHDYDYFCEAPQSTIAHCKHPVLGLKSNYCSKTGGCQWKKKIVQPKEEQ
jgi:histone H3/H4